MLSRWQTGRRRVISPPTSLQSYMEDEAMLYACMHYYDCLSGVNPLTGVFVKDGKYVLFYEKFCMLENLHALIFDEKDFKELLEDHRKYLEEDIRKGRAEYLACVSCAILKR